MSTLADYVDLAIMENCNRELSQKPRSTRYRRRNCLCEVNIISGPGPLPGLARSVVNFLRDGTKAGSAVTKCLRKFWPRIADQRRVPVGLFRQPCLRQPAKPSSRSQMPATPMPPALPQAVIV